MNKDLIILQKLSVYNDYKQFQKSSYQTFTII